MTKLTKKIVSILTTLTVGLMLVGPVGVASAMTSAELQQAIADLQTQLAALTSQLNVVEGTTPTPVPVASGTRPAACVGITFSRSLSVGSTGTDVKCLQALLNTDASTQVAVSGVGSPGAETSYYGNLSKAAVVKFQTKYASEVLASWGLTVGTGFFGSTSRAKANALLAAGTVTPPVDPVDPVDPPTASGVTVALASDTPVPVVIPSSSLYNSLLKLNITAVGGSATVTGIDLLRGGLFANTNISGVSVWDQNGNRLGNIATALTSDSKAIVDFVDDDLVIAAGQTKSLTVKVNLGSGGTSGTLNFSLASAADVHVEGDTAVNGSYPLMGNTMSIADGSASLGDLDVTAQTTGALTAANAASSANENVSVGDTNIEIGKWQFAQTNSLEAVQIEQVIIYIEGTINETKDLGNYKLVDQLGVVVATADTMVERYVTFKLADPYVINKGITRTFTAKADVLDGSSHTFGAQIQNDYDLQVRGVTTGIYVAPSNSAGNAWVNGTSGAIDSVFYRIRTGSLTVTRRADSPSGTVSPGDTQIILAKYDLKAGGEDLQIRQMSMFVVVNDTTYNLTGSIKVQNADTGVAYLSVAGTTASLQSTTAYTLYAQLVSNNLSTYINIPSGETVTLDIIGNIPSTAGTAESYQVYVGGFYTKRLASNDYQTLPGILAANGYSGNALTVASVALTVSENAAFSGVRLARGKSNVKIGEFVLAASAADDIMVSTMKIVISTSTGVQNVYLVRENGTQVGDTVGTPAAAGNSFAVSYMIPKSQTELLSVYADVTTGVSANATSVTAIVLASNTTGYGVNSSRSLVAGTPGSDQHSNPVVLGDAALVIRKSSAAPTSQIIVAGQTGVILNEIEFEAAYEDLTMNALTLELTSASSTLWVATSTFAGNFSRVYLYDGSTLLNTGGTPVSNGHVSITGMDVTLPADTIKTLTVKADITGSGAVATSSVGAINIDYVAGTTTVMAIYSSTGIMDDDITVTDAAVSNNFLFTDVAPVVAAASGWTGSLTGSPGLTETVAKYTITNSGVRTMTLQELRLVANLSGVSTGLDYVQDLGLYDANDVLVATSTLNGASDLSWAATTTIRNSTTSYARFDIDHYNKNAWVVTSTQQIAAGASKTFTVKADTLNIEAGESAAGTNTARFTTYLAGSKGYLSTEVSGCNAITEDACYWNNGDVYYKYTPSGGSELSGLQETDSVNIYGPTLSY